MIYLFTAFYSEASVFIKHFQLTKNHQISTFQEFYNEEAGIRLTVTGVGEIAAASAVSSVCSIYQTTASDLLVNVGTCAGTSDGGIFLCNKITEISTGKTFYPDLLFSHDFQETELLTGMRVLDLTLRDQLFADHLEGICYDMEAAAIYQAGSYHFGPHQMIFLKLVSDRGNGKEVTREQIDQLMNMHAKELCGFLEQMRQFRFSESRTELWSVERESLYVRLCREFHCSKVMSDSLRQHLHYCFLVGTDVDAVLLDMYEKGQLPCKDKREGKQRFEELKQRLFE